jgi:pyridoxal phosphate-dependent aminotransferase EpsN
MGGSEETYVHQAFATNWLSSVGPNLTAFEQEFSTRVGLPAVALASGTAALHLALRLVGVGPGDEVFCSTLTFVAAANAIVYQGGVPVFWIATGPPGTWIPMSCPTLCVRGRR